jgi:hypothetical protein
MTSLEGFERGLHDHREQRLVHPLAAFQQRRKVICSELSGQRILG